MAVWEGGTRTRTAVQPRDFNLPVTTAPYLLAKALALIEWKSCFVEKPLNNGGVRNGSRGRTRTYNPAVNSRMLYH